MRAPQAAHARPSLPPSWHSPYFQMSRIAAGAALAVLGASATAQVQSMSADGSYALDGAAATVLNSSYPSNAFPDVLSFTGSGSSHAGLHSYGNIFGNFGSRSSGDGVYLVNGGFQIVQSFTNTGASAQAATFHFSITPGILQNTVNTTLSGSSYVEAGLNFDLKRDASTVWDSSAALRTDASGVHYSTGGSDTSLYAGGGSMYNVLGVSKDVDLGVINAGQTIQLTYTLTTYANGDAPAGDPVYVPESTFVVPVGWYMEHGCNGYGYGGYGYGGCMEQHPGDVVTVPAHYLTGSPGGSQASSGDPFHVNIGDTDYTVNKYGTNQLGEVTMAPVPEPGEYAMLLGGLGILAWLSRRRRGA